ncbi:AbrB family transcriptional regulator [Synergistales bacterium]|nr:AbrB family transcriptional regulator [Synergistales bacterium]
MDVARISIKGQVTIPLGIRRKLGLKEGDKVVFTEKDGNIVLLNSNRLAFEEFGRSMSGVAEELRLHSEQDVIDMCKEIRRERRSVIHSETI